MCRVFNKQCPKEFLNQLFIVIGAYAIYIMVGINRSYSTFLIPQLHLPTSVIHISDEEQYWIENLNTFIVPSGCLIGGIIADMFGRKILLISTFFPCIIGWLAISALNSIVTLYIGIILNAISSGMAFCTIVYIAEISSYDTRSIFLNLKEPAFAIGVIASNLMIKRNGWRLSAYYCLALSIVLLILQCFLPESPSWLISNDNNDDNSNNRNSERTAQILTLVRYSQAEVEKEIFDANTHRIRNNIIPNSYFLKTVVWLKHLFRCRKQFAIMFGLIVLQQSSGVNILTGCTVILYDELRIPLTQQVTFIHSATGFLASFIPFLSSLYLDRKRCLITSGLGMCVASCLMAAYETKYQQQQFYYKPYFWIVLTGIYAYYFFASIAVLVQTSVLAAELFPTHVNGIGCGICGSVLYLSGILSRYLFTLLLEYVSLSSMLWFMAICSLISVPFAKYVLPETQDKTLHQIQAEYFRK